MYILKRGARLVFVIAAVLISANVECLKKRGRTTKLKRGDTYGRCGLNYTPPNYDSVIIWLHGLCGSAMDWERFVLFVINRGYLPDTKWILPTSRYRKITALNGNKCPAWFDITSFSPSANMEDTVGILESAERIQGIIRGEIKKGISSSRIYLVGFSQGSAMALGTAITIKGITLGGVIGISGWIPMSLQLQHGERSQYNSELFDFKVDKNKIDNLNVLVFHGSDDVVISLDVFTQSIAFLNDLGFKNINQRLFFGIGHTLSTLEGVQAVYEISKHFVPDSINPDLTLVEDSTYINRAYGMIMKTQNKGTFYDIYKPMPCNPFEEDGLTCSNENCHCSNSVIFFDRSTFKDKFQKCDRSCCSCIIVEAELEGDLYLDMDSLDTSLGGTPKSSGSYVLDTTQDFISSVASSSDSPSSGITSTNQDEEVSSSGNEELVSVSPHTATTTTATTTTVTSSGSTSVFSEASSKTIPLVLKDRGNLRQSMDRVQTNNSQVESE
ncbi:carboxylesterase [Cryptosporidium ryanae]|uniref:carboxylesterase n=1 Tax=Cryptosporidium ryanae TaxID=515981 RepID=UPI00351A5569|nr:carboxylesterase [Cryptosporidium ryanae]